MSFSYHDYTFQHRIIRRVLLFQLNDTNVTSAPLLSKPPSHQPIQENGSEIFPPIQPPAIDDYNEDSKAKEFPPSPLGAGSNFLNTSHGANNDVIIPIPDWSTALEEWGTWWELHVFGSAVLFLALALTSVGIFIRFRHRVLRFQIVLNTLVLLATSGLFRAVFLLVDAYGHQFRMSGYLVGIMTQAVYPLLCACFGLTQVMLVKVTNVDVGPKKFRSLSSLLGCTLGYLFLIVVIESIVYLEPHLKLLLLVDSGCFIAWSLYLAITFICSGFRLSQYTSETKKARKELNAFSIQRKSASNVNTLSTVSNSSNDACFSSLPPESCDTLHKPQVMATDFSEETTSASFPSSSSCSFSNYAAPHSKTSTIRLSRPKMKIADHNHMTIAMVTDDDDESTSSTDVEQSPCNMSHKVGLHKNCSRHQKRRSSKSRTRQQYKTKHDAAVERLLSIPNEKEGCENQKGKTPTPDHKHHSNAHSIRKHKGNKSNSMDDKNSNECSTDDQIQSFKLFQKSSHDVCIDINTLTNTDTSPEDLHCLDTMGFHENNNHINTQPHITTNHSDGPITTPIHKNTETELLSPDDACSSVKENGYLADTEIAIHSKTPKVSGKSRHKKSRYDSTESSSDTKDRDSDCDDSDTTPPFSLSDRLPRDVPAIMSLFRIRQSKMVHRAVHLTYFLTFLFVFACLMQLYTVFGVYGVLGRVRRPHPWPWLIFHTIFRLLECSIGFTCAAIAFITLNSRHQRAKRRMQQQQQQQQEHQHQQEQQHHSSDQNMEQQTSLVNTRECVV